MKRKITLLLMALMVMTTAFSQTTRSKGESLVPGAESPKGPDWELFTFGGKSYNYYKGNPVVDAITVDNLLGGHWMGNELSTIIENKDTFYLCNVETGEYLLVGDYWGETSMTNHVGMPYVILPYESTRRDGWGGPLSDMKSGTYWIQPTGVREKRVIGRASRNDGALGHFEYNGYLFLRNQKEYEGDSKGESGEHPGGFLFKLEPVSHPSHPGKQLYLIYTHRKTNFANSGDNQRRREFENRDSYLMMSSINKDENEHTDYTRVRFKKFAGQMYGNTIATKKVYLINQDDLEGITDATSAQATNAHKYGTYDNAAAATTYTTNSTSGMAGIVVTAGAGANMYADFVGGANVAHYGHVMSFNPSDTEAHTITLTAPSGYVITGYDIVALSTSDKRLFTITPEGRDAVTNIGGYLAKGNINVSNIATSSTTLTIQAANTNGNYLCFAEFKVSLAPLGTATNVTLGDQTNILADNMNTVKTTAAHKYGTYSAPAGGTTYTTNATSGLENVVMTADGAFLRAAWFENGQYLHTMMFGPNNDAVHTVTVSVPSGYVITGYNAKAIVTNGARTFHVAFEGETPVEIKTSQVEFSGSGLAKQTLTFTIKAKDNYSTAPAADSHGLCFPIFNITVAQVGDLIDGYIEFEEGAAPRGDEIAYYEAGKQNVTLSEGMTAAKADPHNLWKLVTKKQRDRYRIVASDKKPVDVSSRIFNPKFNTSYVYNVKKGSASDQAHWDDEDNHWEMNQENLHPDYGWTWYNKDRPEHNNEVHKQHVHPHNLASTDNGYWGIGNEFHKIGTGQFFRFWDTAGGKWDDGQEIAITYGQEANYCGSIYKGTANVQQTITGLREGNYIVFVRGFFAPHNMLKYTKSGDTYQFNGETMAAGGADTSVDDFNWKKQALIRVEDDGTPVWRRSHDSYLFAWSHPKGKTRKATQEDVEAGRAAAVGEEIKLASEEVRRMLPSVYEGATKIADIGNLSKMDFVNSEKFKYTQVGGYFDANTRNQVVNIMKDENVYAFFNDGFFGNEGSDSYIVPKTIYGAGRIFNATDATDHAAAQNYRIGLPVYVGPDGELTIGVDHTYVTDNPDDRYNSGNHEWVCFDEFELIYQGAEEDEIFMVDELNKQGVVASQKYINGYTGKPFEAGDDEKPGLWDETLRPYYEAAITGDGMSPSTNIRQNNSQLNDIFTSTDISTDGLTARKIKTVLIRRTMSKDNWNYIVLPMPLSRNQVEQGFGENVAVSKLSTVRHRTLVYDSVYWDKDNKDGAYLLPGQPYIIRPSANPTIGEADSFERPTFTVKHSTTEQGVAGLPLRSDYYRNYEIDHTLQGPIYVIEDVEIIKGTVFPNDGPTGTEQWTAPTGLAVPVKVSGYDPTYTLKEFTFYENPDPDGLEGPELGVPANSYYLNKGKWRYTSTGFSTSKGMLTYIQLINTTTNEAMARPFLDGSLDFEIIDVVNGIEDVNNDIEPDDKIEIYDLMGRRVKRTGKGLYIMNGKKVLFK